MGKFSTEETPTTPPTSPTVTRVTPAVSAPGQPKPALAEDVTKLLRFIADVVVNGPYSILYNPQPPDITILSPLKPTKPLVLAEMPKNAKWILDNQGPDAVVKWITEQRRVLVTDTTMRDAHQSLIATRVRTADLLCAAEETAVALNDAFSLEMWGGATFDVCLQFLHECPWKRLRYLRTKIPNICFQMLIRGSNAVGYTSYPDNLIVKFIHLAAKNGIDVFRIFDCFNDLSQMLPCIKTVKECGKIAEVCMCFTGNFLSPDEKIYTLNYYVDLAKRIDAAGAHIIAIKDMAGLFRPQMAIPFMEALRSATKLPIHFHTHNTSSAAFTAVVNMANAGCHVVDVATASMADTTSQPSMNAFLAAMEGSPRDPHINYLTLEKLDLLWGNIRAAYHPFESGLRCGTARVYDHQIPGGQYTNLIAQCKSLGIWHKWGGVLDMYRDVNKAFGDIIKVTPSSKCVGDMALYLVTNNLTCQDLFTKGKSIDFPNSVTSLFKGLLGVPHHGFPSELTDIILRGGQPIKGRPNDNLPPADFDAARETLRAKHQQEFSEEDIVSALFYPKEFNEYVQFAKKYGGDNVMHLATYTFMFGMKINSVITLSNPVDASAPTYAVKLQRVGPLSQENYRTVEFMVNKTHSVAVKLKETRADTVDAAATTLANPADKSHVPSPLPGIVDKIYVKVGDKVTKSTVLMSVAAMKMEVQVVAPHAGIVEKLCVQVGSKVDNKSLLAQVVENPTV